MEASKLRSRNDEPIAIIGLGLNFPQQTSTPRGFWELLVRGASARTEVPPDRYNAESFFNPGDKSGSIATKHGHFIAEPLDRFDAQFFSISPHEAECMDPQQRMLLETTYHALENAGISLDQLQGSRTSVFVGCFMNDHETMVRKDLEMPNAYHATGDAISMLANRISWFYNLHGPSVSVNTACSASLVALHLACQSICMGETEMSLVCGSNLIFAPEATAGLSNLGFLSPDGRCYAFDQRANGYSRGEGIACVVIKPLSRALRDADTIRAIIRGTGVNSDGRTPGITKPNCEAQTALMIETYRRSGLDPSQTQYFEAHGTGTRVGDPLEAKAIATVFGPRQRGDNPLYVGALKSNIGHLEGASGLASLIKAVLVLENALIPPNIWLNKVNTAIEEGSGLIFPTRCVDFPGGGLRRASINSFGFGGTNAHVIVDEASSCLRELGLEERAGLQAPPSSSQDDSEAKVLELLVWSAADEDGLRRLRDAYRSYIGSTGARGKKWTGDLRDLAYTLSRRRTHLPWRGYTICERLQNNLDLEISAAVKARADVRICFVFTGQGAQWPAMGRELLIFDAYRHSIEHSDNLLRGLGCQFSVFEKLYAEDKKFISSEFDSPEFCQPICTAFQIALVDLLKDWGVSPYVVVGHSSGEIAAAYCARVISKQHALGLAFFRGIAVAASLQAEPRKGGMLAVRHSVEKCEELLSRLEDFRESKQEALNIACFNSPRNVTLSGDIDMINRLKLLLEAENITAKTLNVDVAYHNTQHMETAGNLYKCLIRSLLSADDNCGSSSGTTCLFASSLQGNVTGNGLDDSNISKIDYWIDNLVFPVQFAEAVRRIVSLQKDEGTLSQLHFLEVGPHSSLRSAIKDLMLPEWDVEQGYSSIVHRQQNALTTSKSMAGRLFCLGYPVDIEAVNRPSSRSGIGCKSLSDLPVYPFDHSRKYWIESRISKGYRHRRFPRHGLLGAMVPDWNPLEPQWNNRLSLRNQPFVKEHKVSSILYDAISHQIEGNLRLQIAGTSIYPASAFLVMAIEAMRQLDAPCRGHKGYRFENVDFHNSLKLPAAGEGIETQFRLSKNKQPGYRPTAPYDFRLYMYEYQEWILCCHGSIGVEHEATNSIDLLGYAGKDDREVVEACRIMVERDRFYSHLRDCGFDYGSNFQITGSMSYGERQRGFGEVTLRTKNLNLSCLVDPAALDCVFQVAFVGLTHGGDVEIPTLIPTEVKKLWISADIPWRIDPVIQVSAHPTSIRERSYDVKYAALWKGDERPFLTGEVTLTSIGNMKTTMNDKQDHVSLYEVDWKPHPDLLLPSLATSTFLSGQVKNDPSEANKILLTEGLCYLAMSEVVDALQAQEKGYNERPTHLRKYFDWMKHQVASMQTSETWHRVLSTATENVQSRKHLQQRVKSLGPEGRLVAKLSKRLPQIVHGDLNALELLFEDETLAEYYRLENPPPEVSRSVQRYVDCMAHVNPYLKVLEIGAGTGGMTQSVLDVLRGPRIGHSVGSAEGERFAEYIFTDISPTFFAPAVKKFGRSGFVCQVLDIEKSIEEQGFKPESYDLIIASNVLHATRCLSDTLANTRKLLKENGKLMLVEAISPNSLRSSFIFGGLPGWWLSTEPYRQWGPLVPTERWDEILRDNRFTGTDFIIDGVDPACSRSSLIISTAEGSRPQEDKSISNWHISVLRNETSSLQKLLASAIQSKGKEAGLHVTITNANWPSEASGTLCVLLWTIDHFSFQSPEQDGYILLQKVFSNFRSVLWITQRNRSEVCMSEQDAVLGLTRSLLSESERLKIVTLALEDVEDFEKAKQHIYTVLCHCFETRLGTSDPTCSEEVAEVDGVLCVSRLLEARTLQDDVESIRAKYKTAEIQKFDMQNDDIDRPSRDDRASSLKAVVSSLSESQAITRSRQEPLKFRANATYLISGGLGGLGRSIAKWMVAHGTRNLLLLSRKGGTDSAARQFLDELALLGVNVSAPKCDIGDEITVEEALRDTAQRMPPIKGCIQASMVLESAMFQNLSQPQWVATLRSKVAGSFNLQKHLPRGLDFFVMLSSVCGIIGASGQSNYAFACAYQDALARSQVAAGQKAISIDLGIIEGVGYTAEHHVAGSIMRSLGMQPIPEEYLHSLLEYYCNQNGEDLQARKAQIIVGIMTLDEIQHNGLVKPRFLSRPLMRHLSRVERPAYKLVVPRSQEILPEPSNVIPSTLSRPQSQAPLTVSKAICDRLSEIIGLASKDVNAARPLHAFGVDSLIAIELRNWFREALGLDVAVFDILSNLPINELAKKVASTQGDIERETTIRSVGN